MTLHSHSDSSDWARNAFMILESGVPVVREIDFLDLATAEMMKARIGDKEEGFRLSLRDAGI